MCRSCVGASSVLFEVGKGRGLRLKEKKVTEDDGNAIDVVNDDESGDDVTMFHMDMR